MINFFEFAISYGYGYNNIIQLVVYHKTEFIIAYFDKELSSDEYKNIEKTILENPLKFIIGIIFKGLTNKRKFANIVEKGRFRLINNMFYIDEVHIL